MLRRLFHLFLFLLLPSGIPLLAQTATDPATIKPADRIQFFLDNGPLELHLNADFKKVKTQKVKGIYLPASATLRRGNEPPVSTPLRLYARGEYRRKNCYMPGLMLNFKTDSTTLLSPLKKMKLVCGCTASPHDEQLIFKEYLCYKMYQALTDLSFRTRLVKVHFNDKGNRLKPYTQYGFLLEDVDELARRNGCAEINNRIFLTERTNRQQMTLVALFQYMIGNTDWDVPNNHNCKLVRQTFDSTAMPYVVPYDFDFAGLVNAPYAIPSPGLPIEKVTERLYRGFPRRLEEIEEALNLFRSKKEQLLMLVQNFDLLQKRERTQMLKYLNDFFDLIQNKDQVRYLFVSGARLQ